MNSMKMRMDFGGLPGAAQVAAMKTMADDTRGPRRDVPRRAADTAVEAIVSDASKVRLAGALISRASVGSDVRFEKVAMLREAIEAGTYRVDAGEIAEKLMRVRRDDGPQAYA